MEKPKTMQRMVDALWYAVFGMNDTDGMLSMVKALWEDRKGAWTRADHYKERTADQVAAEQLAETKKEEKTQQSISAATWVSTAVAIVAMIVAIVAIVVKRAKP
jgi:hypothetical protein